MVKELLPYQESSVTDALSLSGYGLSNPRQNGKTEVGVEIAIRAALVQEEKVMYLSQGSDSAREVLHRTEEALRHRYPSLHFKAKRSFGNCEIELPGAYGRLAPVRILFRSYNSRGQSMRHTVDRLILDDFMDQVDVRTLQIHFKPRSLTYLGLGLKVPVPTLYYGADPWEDYRDIEVFKRVNPAAGQFQWEGFFEESLAAMPEDVIRRELLNVRMKR